MNYRERLEQSQGRQGSISDVILSAEMERGFSCEYFATDNIKSLPACLDLRLPDGNREFLPYSLIVEISYKIADGITILTTTKKIIITGRNLGKLLDYLGAYRVRFITANVGEDLNDNGLFVQEIIIEELN